MEPRESEQPRVHLLSGILVGGAANAAKHLLRGLTNQGLEAQLYYPASLKVGPETTQLHKDGCQPVKWNVNGIEKIKRGISYRLHRQSFKKKLRGRDSEREIFTSPRGAPYTPWPPTNVHPQLNDIIHLHWVARFIDYPSFFQSLPKNQPVVWTLHDMNPFTGGCHFTEGCEQFTQECGNCPQLPHSAEGDLSRDFFAMKRDSLRDLNLHIVTVSRWMMEQCKKSPIFDHVRSFHHIPYGLAMDEFQPIDRLEARKKLGIDSDAFVFAFGAADIRNHRKGFRPLLESLAAIADVPKAIGLVFGGGEMSKVDYPLPELRTMGFIQEVKQMVLIYSACDVFILPSLEDNLPFTCLEALATGTPVVAFDAGGVPDMVRPGLTGWILPNGDSAAMGQQLKHIAKYREEAVKLGIQTRKIAIKEYSQQREAADYAKLYAALLSEL